MKNKELDPFDIWFKERYPEIHEQVEKGDIQARGFKQVMKSFHKNQGNQNEQGD